MKPVTDPEPDPDARPARPRRLTSRMLALYDDPPATVVATLPTACRCGHPLHHDADWGALCVRCTLIVPVESNRTPVAA